MVAQPPVRTSPEIIYPDSDRHPLADNTKQFRWIVTLKENLEILFAQDPNIFIAGDLLWYPVEGNNKLRQAPDAMVVFGRPKDDRGSYRQWQEDNIAPQVVFEIFSPGNRRENSLVEMTRKALFYQNYGVEEYYLYDPDSYELSGWQWRGPNRPQSDTPEIADMQGWVSPRLGIRFELGDDGLVIYNPQGTPFLTSVELAQQRDSAQQQRDEVQQKAERLAAKLRELGVDPDKI